MRDGCLDEATEIEFVCFFVESQQKLTQNRGNCLVQKERNTTVIHWARATICIPVTSHGRFKCEIACEFSLACTAVRTAIS